jgi:hypothetical protein
MGNTAQLDSQPSTREAAAPARSQEEVLRTVKLALATGSNYGRGTRQQGSNPYDSRLGRPQHDVWGRGKRPA